MPRNLEEELRNAQAETDKFTQGAYGYDPMPSIRERTGGFLSKALQGVSQDPNAMNYAKTATGNRVNREAQRKFDMQRLQQDRQRYTMIFNTLVDRLQQSGMRYEEAVQYARQNALSLMQQEAEASEAEKDRAFGLKMEDMNDVYSNRMEGLNTIPETDYQSALLRGLTGMAGNIGAYKAYSWAKNRGGSNIPTNYDVPAASSTDLPYGPGQNLGYFPEKPTGGFYE